MEKHTYQITIHEKDEGKAYWGMVKALQAANVKFDRIKQIKD